MRLSLVSNKKGINETKFSCPVLLMLCSFLVFLSRTETSINQVICVTHAPCYRITGYVWPYTMKQNNRANFNHVNYKHFKNLSAPSLYNGNHYLVWEASKSKFWSHVNWFFLVITNIWQQIQKIKGFILGLNFKRLTLWAGELSFAGQWQTICYGARREDSILFMGGR